MKKAITLLMAVALAMPTFAQVRKTTDRFNHSNLEQYYGLRLGLNMASLSSDDAAIDSDSRTGLSFGAVYGLQLATDTPVWLEAGAFYSEKGGKINFQGDKVTTRLSYLQVPVVVKYSFDVYENLYVQPLLGGYLSLGLGGKIKDYGEHEASASFDTFNRFDGGLRIGCGVEYQMVYAELGFDFGLADISKDDFDSTHTRNFFINVGVNF